MRGKVKVISAVACVAVIFLCYIFYKQYVSEAIYGISTPYSEAESCSARVLDAVPEGYFSYYYDDDDLAGMKVVEVTWRLCNNTNERKQTYSFWASYSGMDGRYLDVLEEDTEDLILPGYENNRVIPPGEQTDFIEYVLVPKESHEMKVKPGSTASQTGGEEPFVITF